MKGPIYSVILCFGLASSAMGRDSMEMSREHRIFCSLFVIDDPHPVIGLEPMNYCCRPSNRAHDCHVDDWEEKVR